jgi:hypothetical protein
LALVSEYRLNKERCQGSGEVDSPACAADAVPLNAVIMIDPNSSESIDPDRYRNKWVEVRERIHFFPKPGSDEFITALILYPPTDEPRRDLIKLIAAPASPWVN